MASGAQSCGKCGTSTYAAAANGHKDCLEFCVAHDCPWLPETTLTVAAHGRKDCLEFCVSNGCPWDPETTRVAAANGHKDCLEFCVAQGCPWHPETTRTAAMYGHKECLEFIFENCKELTDIGTWENSGLEDKIDTCSTEIQNYLRSVREEWTWYSERDINIKG